MIQSLEEAVELLARRYGFTKVIEDEPRLNLKHIARFYEGIGLDNRFTKWVNTPLETITRSEAHDLMHLVLDAGGKAWSRSFNNFLNGIGYVLLTEFEMELLETMYFMEFVGKKFRHEALRKFIGGGEKAIELYWNVTSNELKISLAGAAALLYSRALAAGIRDRKTLRFAVRAATLYGREKKDRGVLKTAIEYVGEIKQVSYGDLMNGLNAAMTYLGLSIDGEGYRQMLCNVYKLYERFFKLMECSGAKPSSDMLSSFERYQLQVADIITRKNADFYREVSRDSGIRYLSLELKKLADEFRELREQYVGFALRNYKGYSPLNVRF